MELGNKNFMPSDELRTLSKDLLEKLTLENGVKCYTKANDVKILHNKILGVKPMDVIANE